jgi:hypothetical protein
MIKKKYYYQTKFPAEVIEEADDIFSKLSSAKVVDRTSTVHFTYYHVGLNDESWLYDSWEEFLSEYQKAERYVFTHNEKVGSLTVQNLLPSGTVTVEVGFPDRKDIESILSI